MYSCEGNKYVSLIILSHDFRVKKEPCKILMEVKLYDKMSFDLRLTILKLCIILIYSVLTWSTDFRVKDLRRSLLFLLSSQTLENPNDIFAEKEGNLVPSSLLFEFFPNEFCRKYRKYELYYCVWTCYLVWKTSACYLFTRKTQATESIFKMTPIHDSVIYQIPWFCWIQWKAPIDLRKTPLLLTWEETKYWSKGGHNDMKHKD